MDMFFQHLLPDNISNLNYNFINAQFILSIKDILHMKNQIWEDSILRGYKMKCVWFGMHYFKNCECVNNTNNHKVTITCI